MKPIYFTLRNGRALIAVPETQVILDGHPVLSLNYNIFVNESNGKSNAFVNSKSENLPEKKDPNYIGFITFEEPGKMYSYTAETDRVLNRSEVEEAIEFITHIRDNPKLWQADIN